MHWCILQQALKICWSIVESSIRRRKSTRKEASYKENLATHMRGALNLILQEIFKSKVKVASLI